MYVPSFADRIDGSATLRRRQKTARVLTHALSRVEVYGVERVPQTGPVVLAVNHRAFLDGPMTFAFVTRPLNFLVKIEAFTPVVAPFLRTTGQIPVDRSRIDLGAIRLALEILNHGGVVGIFPEGSRGDGAVREAKPGVGYLAVRTGAQVVPVAWHGTDVVTARRGMGRPPARVTFGAPIDLGHVPAGKRVRRQQMLEATEQVRAALADLVLATRPQASA